MSEIKYISKNEYAEMFESFKQNIRGQSLNLDPYFYTPEMMKEEYRKMMNPDLPMSITVHGNEGTIIYRIKP